MKRQGDKKPVYPKPFIKPKIEKQEADPRPNLQKLRKQLQNTINHIQTNTAKQASNTNTQQPSTTAPKEPPIPNKSNNSTTPQKNHNRLTNITIHNSQTPSTSRATTPPPPRTVTPTASTANNLYSIRINSVIGSGPQHSHKISKPESTTNNTTKIATISPPNPPNTMAPSTASTANHQIHMEDVSAIASAPPKMEPGTSTQQTQNQPNRNNRKANNQQMKNAGLIQISLHGTDVYNKEEMMCILHSLRARTATNPGPNLWTAQVRTGTYTHAAQTHTNINTNGANIEIGPIIDQTTQVSGQQIDDEIRAINIANRQNLKTIPDLIMNQEIIESTTKPQEVNFNQKAFINYTTHPIPEDIAVILSMGPKFAVPVYHKLKDFEDLKQAAIMINDAHGHIDEMEAVRRDIENHITSFVENEWHELKTEIKDYFHNALKSTKQFLKDHPDIIAAQSDKARATILMDKQVYKDKINNLLTDRSTYQPLTQSSGTAYMKMNRKLLERFEERKMITNRDVNMAIGDETKVANLYGLLKNHKTNHPIRPIVNTRSSPGFLVTKIATRILSRIRDKGSKYNVLNSRQACEKIRQTRILPDEKIYSLDIVSMFTNITTERAIEAVKKRQSILKISYDTMQLVLDVIKFNCIQSTEIKFDDVVYKQIKGLRMGSALSPILADLVVEDMLDDAFLKLKRPKLLMKYVDDIFCIMESTEANDLLNALNQCDPNIKFEMEEEQNGRLNYLDITVYRDQLELKTVWYQKHVSSGTFLNFHSNHSKSNIWNTAVQYVITMIMNTHPDHYREIVVTAKERLARNSYPQTYISEVINEAINKIKEKDNQETTTENQNEVIKYINSLNHIPQLTNKIQQRIQTSATKKYEKTTQIPAKPMYTLSQQIFNKHKNSNQTLDIIQPTTSYSIDLTQPNTHNTQP